MNSFFGRRGAQKHQNPRLGKGRKRDKKMLAIAPTNPRCTIGTKIMTNAMHVTSLAECSRRYGGNNKTRIIFGSVLEVETGPKATALGRRRTFIVAIFDLGRGSMKVATINIRSVKFHTPEPPRPSTGGDGEESAAAFTTNTTGDKTVTDPVSVQVFEAPERDSLNDESFRVVVAQPMSETPGRPLSPLTEAGGLVVGGVLAHVMDASTVEMPSPPTLPLLLPLPQILPVPLPLPPLPLIPAPRTPSPKRRSPGERPTTRSHSTGERDYFHGRKWFEDSYGV